MKWMVSAAVGAVLVFSLCLAFVSASESFSCYECNTFNDPSCKDRVGPMHLKNCTEQKKGSAVTMCRKIRQWVDFDVLGMKANERIIRTCGSEKTPRACYYRAGFGGRQEVCTCYSENCNDATRMATHGPAILLMSMATAILGVRHMVV